MIIDRDGSTDFGSFSVFAFIQQMLTKFGEKAGRRGVGRKRGEAVYFYGFFVSSL